MTNDITENDLLAELIEQAGASDKPGQVYIYKNESSHYFGRFIRLNEYTISYTWEKPPAGSYSSEPAQIPVLGVRVSLVDHVDENGSFIGQDRTETKTYSDFMREGLVRWSGSHSERTQQAADLLDGKGTIDLNAELTRLQAGEEAAEQQAQTGLVTRHSKEHFESVLALTRDKKEEMTLITTLMTMEMNRRMKQLQRVRDQARGLVGGLLKKMQRLQRYITMIELYIGVSEELHQLRKGVSAFAGEPISFRQRCLFMDEEVAIRIGFANAVQFDFNSVEIFDEWLLEPGNLDYVLPEQRGIVVFRPRRFEKEYGMNWFLNSFLNRENLTYTYFLIRDGENVYRIFTSRLTVLDRLFPKRDELAQMFARQEAAFYESDREKLEDSMYQYRKLAMFLQGLLDRTTVFGPLNRPINLFALTTQTEAQIQFIYDDDDNLIGDGRPTFRQWQLAQNKSIEIGSRVLLTGRYGNWETKKAMQNRLFYWCHEHRVPSLPPQDLYVVERPAQTQPWDTYFRATPGVERPMKDMCIRYNPSDQVGVYGWAYDPHTRKNRISWAIRRDDEFILHYDVIHPDDVQYYLHSRAHRAGYVSMLPVLETLLVLKQEELKSEEPFVRLVVDECVRNKISVREETVWNALSWWKMRNQWKRAICVDDAKALRMILSHLKRSPDRLPSAKR